MPAIMHDRLPPTFSVKAILLHGVLPSEMLYTTEEQDGLCAVAVRDVGRGRVAFFGDVNFEDHTYKVMSALGMNGFTYGKPPHPHPLA